MKLKNKGGSGLKVNNVLRLVVFISLLSPLLAATTACGKLGDEYYAFDCHLPDRVIEYRLWNDKSDWQVWAEDKENKVQMMITQGNKDWLMENLSTEYPKHCRMFGGKVEEIIITPDN